MTLFTLQIEILNSNCFSCSLGELSLFFPSGIQIQLVAAAAIAVDNI